MESFTFLRAERLYGQKLKRCGGLMFAPVNDANVPGFIVPVRHAPSPEKLLLLGFQDIRQAEP